MAARLRKDDEVEVLSGADKGKRGKILRISPKTNRAVVQGVRMVRHHRRAKAMGETGGVHVEEGEIDLSNLMLVDPVSGKRTKVGFRLEQGDKVRFAKASNSVIKG